MSIKRREFLKLSTAAACLGAASSTQAMESFDGWPDRYGMLTDTTLCIGANCRRCEEACKKVNERPMDGLDLTDNSVFDEERRTDPNSFTVVNRFDNPNDQDNPVIADRGDLEVIRQLRIHVPGKQVLKLHDVTALFQQPAQG